jgi:SAM-dependent methyltransferase
MKQRTRRQLHALSLAFYEAHAEAFDASRVDLPWPGWKRVARALPRERLSVLDIGCGNGRFARFLHEAGLRFDYTGIDANATLLDAARDRVGPTLEGSWQLLEQDFLASSPPGRELPEGPFGLVALMGVLHHVPSAELRVGLLQAAAGRLAPGGVLALTAWQFAARERFERRLVDWSSVPPVLGAAIELDDLEPGDCLLRFGDDPAAPPRYCHQIADAEFERWSEALGLRLIDDFRSDGAQGDLNRYALLARD